MGGGVYAMSAAICRRSAALHETGVHSDDDNVTVAWSSNDMSSGYPSIFAVRSWKCTLY